VGEPSAQTRPNESTQLRIPLAINMLVSCRLIDGQGELSCCVRELDAVVPVILCTLEVTQVVSTLEIRSYAEKLYTLEQFPVSARSFQGGP